jgi:hypothetical protein
MSNRLKGKLVALLAIGVIAFPAMPGLAAEQAFKVTVVDRLVSVEVVGNQLLVEAEGSGHSMLLGPITTSTSAVQTLVPGCQPASVEFTVFAEGGTIEIHNDSIVCQDRIEGVWEVVSGTGEFEGVTGSGTLKGSPSHPPGRDPAVIHWEGNLDF